MTPEERLDEAAKQLGIILQDHDLDEITEDHVGVGLLGIDNAQARLKDHREAQDDAEVVVDEQLRDHRGPAGRDRVHEALDEGQAGDRDPRPGRDEGRHPAPEPEGRGSQAPAGPRGCPVGRQGRPDDPARPGRRMSRSLPRLSPESLEEADRRLAHLEDVYLDEEAVVPAWLQAARIAVDHLKQEVRHG